MAMRKIIYKNTSNGIQDDSKKYNTTLEIVFDFFFPMPFPYWEYIFCKEILTMYSINFLVLQ